MIGTMFWPWFRLYAVAYAANAFPKSRMNAPRNDGISTGMPT